ncbi:MAG: DnaJ family molecular chaperone [Pseudomonadota bacterium]
MAETVSVWRRVADIAARSAPVSWLRRPEDPTRTTTFTIGVIALAAKIAKADGQVTPDEVAVFREIFHVAPEDEARVGQVYNLLREDTAGYEVYAQQLRTLFDHEKSVLKDILDALFAIAMADGEFHENEEAFLKTCREIFDVTPSCYREIKARWVPDAWDPLAVLGIEEEIDADGLRARYRQLVRDNHPDRLLAKGLPVEMIELADRRMADINRAYAELAAA